MPSSSAEKTGSVGGKNKRLSQTQFPNISLEKALRISKALYDNFAGKSAAPHDVAIAIGLSPTSGRWRNLCGASIAYGLTKGGAFANDISLVELGRRCVAPTTEGDEKVAKAEAVLTPKIMGEFFRKYNRAKFPKEDVVKNILVQMGVPLEKSSKCLDILKENGIATGVLVETPTGYFVTTDITNDKITDSPATGAAVPETHSSEGVQIPNQEQSAEHTDHEKQTKDNNRVFISHGKNRKIVGHLKDLLSFGNYKPVVSVEKETPSIPVPDKVLQDMRSCSAAVIHVGQEEEFIDAAGEPHIKLNENVLIEIGAAMALYDKKFVLLVEKGVELPSNLQGMYRCEYEGDTLDGEATMKLLRTFNQFK